MSTKTCQAEAWFHQVALVVSLLCCVALRCDAQTRQLAASLQPYVNCRSVAGATLVQMTPLVAAPSKRTVQTLQGDKQIDIDDGARLNYSMNSVDYAYARVEQLSASTYIEDRRNLLSNFKRMVSGDELAFPADTLAEKMQGFYLFGSDHKEMLGETLGMYLVLDDRNRVAVTIYFQNASLAKRTFTDMEGYSKLRDAFLGAYIGCVRSALGR